MHLFTAVPRVPFSPANEKLRNALRPARVVPPHGWNLVGAAKHLRQFLFDLQQAAGTYLSRRLLYWTVRPPLRIDRIHVPEVGDLLTQAGKAFWNVSHTSSIRLKLSSRYDFFARFENARVRRRTFRPDSRGAGGPFRDLTG